MQVITQWIPGAILAVIVVLVVVAVMRWALRINHICRRLDEIAGKPKS